MILHWILDYLECLTKLEPIWDVSLTSFFVYLAFNRAKRIHYRPYCRVTGEKINPFLKVKVNTVIIHQILLKWNSVMEKTRSWIFRSKSVLLKLATWKKKINPMFSSGALLHSAVCKLNSQQPKFASRNCNPHNSIGKISKYSSV